MRYMCSISSCLAAFVASAGLAYGQIALEDFESLTTSTSINAKPGWSVVSGSASVSSLESANGGAQSLALDAGTSLSEAVRTVQAAEWGSASVAWWDLWVLPMSQVNIESEFLISAGGSGVGFRATSVAIDGSEIVPYSGAQDGQFSLPTSATVADGGTTIRLEGNVWKAIPFQYSITSQTVLTFDLKVDEAGEVVAITLDDDLTHDNVSLFRLSGSQSVPWFNDFSYSGPDYETFSIPIGQYMTGAKNYIALLVDDDANGLGDATFRNIKLHEGNLPTGEQGMIFVGGPGFINPLPVYYPATDDASDNWMRITIRQDVSEGVWDLYLDGGEVTIVANVSFTGSPVAPTEIRYLGDASLPVYVDDLQLVTSSRIFTDNDNDGMSDAWESAHGLSTSANDREGDKDEDTINNIDEYLSGTSPDDFYNDVMPLLKKEDGDLQTAYPGIWLEIPLIASVKNALVEFT